MGHIRGVCEDEAGDDAVFLESYCEDSVSDESASDESADETDGKPNLLGPLDLPRKLNRSSHQRVLEKRKRMEEDTTREEARNKLEHGLVLRLGQKDKNGGESTVEDEDTMKGEDKSTVMGDLVTDDECKGDEFDDDKGDADMRPSLALAPE
eukprot:6217055-Pyramimonas_sp.AAC.1